MRSLCLRDSLRLTSTSARAPGTYSRSILALSGTRGVPRFIASITVLLASSRNRASTYCVRSVGRRPPGAHALDLCRSSWWLQRLWVKRLCWLCSAACHPAHAEAGRVRAEAVCAFSTITIHILTQLARGYRIVHIDFSSDLDGGRRPKLESDEKSM